jgi:prolyl 4-hydroxylase
MDGFLSDWQCDTLCQLATAQGMEDSKVGEDKFELDTNIRKSTQVWFKKEANDVAQYIHDKVKALVEGTSHMHSCFEGISADKNFEDIQVVKYGVQGKYDPHFDGTECGEDVGVKCYENQRLATVLIYLNDDFEGGHTRFPNLGISITPKKGSAVFFWVADRSNRLVYQETLHGGDPVLSGEKWIATQWVRS